MNKDLLLERKIIPFSDHRSPFLFFTALEQTQQSIPSLPPSRKIYSLVKKKRAKGQKGETKVELTERVSLSLVDSVSCSLPLKQYRRSRVPLPSRRHGDSGFLECSEMEVGSRFELRERS